MAKDAERKRKLEQEQLDNSTTKRVKQSAKPDVKANVTANGSPQVVVARQNGLGATKSYIDPFTLSRMIPANGIAVAENDDSATSVSKNAQKRRPSQNGTAANGAAVTSLKAKNEVTEDVSMVDLESTASQHKKSKKERRQQYDESQNVAVAKTEDKRQRAIEKKARRNAQRDVKAGFKENEELTAPNENGWWLSQPSAGRYLSHDPIFVTDENGDDCLIAATIREVQLLHLDSSLIARTHSVPDGRNISAYTLSAAYPDHVEIAYDNGTKVQWNWTTGSTIRGSFPGNETTIAAATTYHADGRPETYYIAQTQGTYTVAGERKHLYSTYRRLTSIQVLERGAYIICLGTTAMLLGKRKENTQSAEYTWIEMPTTVPFQCLDAKVVVPLSSKDSSAGKDKIKAIPDLALAVGNSDGQIHTYSSLTSLFAKPPQAALPPPRILHWHREAVSAVKFSRDGNYLISGGSESVLVIWQLETGQKQFLPHLTAEIERIVVSPNGAQYALQMGDNSIMVLSTTELKPIANFAGLQLPVLTEELQREETTMPIAAVALHPNDSKQLLLTVPATQPKHATDVTTRPFLQTFDVQNSRHIGRQALSRNNVTDFNRGPENTPIIPPDVNLLCVSTDGKWLATVDEWFPPATDLEHAVARTTDLDSIDLVNVQEEQLKRREVYLKFWRWDAAQSMWTLSTRADAPHARSSDADYGRGAGRVLQLKSDPASNGFATVGEDGEIRIWKPKTKIRHGMPLKEPDGDDLVEWICRKTIKLPVVSDGDDRADSPLDGVAEVDKSLSAIDASLAFSPDGSILACSTVTSHEITQPLVHFVNPETGIVTSTNAGIIPADEPVLDLGFLDRYLIVLSLGSIRVWNLVDDTVHYTISLPGALGEQENPMLAVNEHDETFAVSSNTTPSIEVDESVPQIAVYSLKKPEALFEADLESAPVAVLAGKNTKGYTIVFEDGMIRSLSSIPQSSLRRSSLATSDVIDGLEDLSAAEEVDNASSSALALLSADPEQGQDMSDSLAPLMLTEDGEDDRPVVRPEQLSSIFDIGAGKGSVAVPPVRDMFRDVVGLFARRPRARVSDAEMEMEMTCV